MQRGLYMVVLLGLGVSFLAAQVINGRLPDGHPPDTIRVLSDRAYELHPGIEVLLKLTSEQKAALVKARSAFESDSLTLSAREYWNQVSSSSGGDSPEAVEAKMEYYRAKAEATHRFNEVCSRVLDAWQLEKRMEINKAVQEASSRAKEIVGPLGSWAEYISTLRKLGRESPELFFQPEDAAQLRAFGP